jgi:ElaB/YqjD/DUF883 family membrane-anchored ribosome-binding protein
MSMDNPEKKPETDETPESPTTQDSPGLPTEPPAADENPREAENTSSDQGDVLTPDGEVPENPANASDPLHSPESDPTTKAGMPAGAVGMERDTETTQTTPGGRPLSQAVNDLSEAAKTRAREFRESGRKMYDERREDLGDKRDEVRLKFEQKAEDLNRKAVDAVDDAMVKAREWRRKGEEEVRKDPVKGIGIAAGVGFLLALLFTGRRK